MAREVDFDWVGTKNGRGGVARYPYDEWFNGATWEIERGVDFLPARDSIASVLQQRARKHHHGRVLVHYPEDKNKLIFRFQKSESQGRTDREPDAH